MKKISQIVIALVFVATGVLLTSFAMAGVGNVTNTKHNFSSLGGSNVLRFTTENQVCVFCHTPHNANASQPKYLWNKANLSAATNFKLYTSSATLTAATKGSTLTADSPSLLCLGCHDGKTAMNILHSSDKGVAAPGTYPAGTKILPTSNSGAGEAIMPDPEIDLFSGELAPAMNIGVSGGASNGDNLTDDHPIGFSYSNAYNEETAAGLVGLRIKTSVDSRVRFFGANNIVECSTCHDPHVENPAQAPFLVMSNSGSALCLACHIK